LIDKRKFIKPDGTIEINEPLSHNQIPNYLDDDLRQVTLEEEK